VSTRLKQLNTGSLWLLAAGAAAMVVYLLVRLGLRIGEIVPNRDVAVPVPFADTTASLPVGPQGGPVAVAITEGVLHVSGMPAISLVSVLLGETLRAGTAIALIVFFGVFCLRMSRGRIFDRANVRLVLWSGAVLVVGWGAGGLFTMMGVNGAFAALSAHGYDNVGFPTDWAPFIAGLTLLLLSYAFESGMRLQRETEGLV
jgi:hypothetical protein